MQALLSVLVYRSVHKTHGARFCSPQLLYTRTSNAANDYHNCVIPLQVQLMDSIDRIIYRPSNWVIDTAGRTVSNLGIEIRNVSQFYTVIISQLFPGHVTRLSLVT